MRFFDRKAFKCNAFICALPKVSTFIEKKPCHMFRFIFLPVGVSPGNDTPAGQYPKVVKRESGTVALVTQDFWFGKYLGYLKIQFYKNGTLKDWSGNPILLDSSDEQGTTRILVGISVCWLGFIIVLQIEKTSLSPCDSAIENCVNTNIV